MNVSCRIVWTGLHGLNGSFTAGFFPRKTQLYKIHLFPPFNFYLLSLPFPPASLHFVLFSFPPPFSFPFHFLFFLFFPRPFLSPAFPFPLSLLFPESSQEVWLHKCTVMELHRLQLERYSLCGTRSACQSEYAGIVQLHGVLPAACYKRFVSYRVSMVLRGGGVVVICICTRARLGSAGLDACVCVCRARRWRGFCSAAVAK